MEKKLNRICNIISAILFILLLVFATHSFSKDDELTKSSTNIPSFGLTDLEEARDRLSEIEDILFAIDQLGNESEVYDTIDEIEEIKKSTGGDVDVLLDDVIWRLKRLNNTSDVIRISDDLFSLRYDIEYNIDAAIDGMHSQ